MLRFARSTRRRTSAPRDYVAYFSYGAVTCSRPVTTLRAAIRQADKLPNGYVVQLSTHKTVHLSAQAKRLLGAHYRIGSDSVDALLALAAS